MKQNLGSIYQWSEDLNLGQLGKRHKSYLCAMALYYASLLCLCAKPLCHASGKCLYAMSSPWHMDLYSVAVFIDFQLKSKILPRVFRTM